VKVYSSVKVPWKVSLLHEQCVRFQNTQKQLSVTTVDPWISLACKWNVKAGKCDCVESDYCRCEIAGTVRRSDNGSVGLGVRTGEYSCVLQRTDTGAISLVPSLSHGLGTRLGRSALGADWGNIQRLGGDYADYAHLCHAMRRPRKVV
jgi:hypothetical protein